MVFLYNRAVERRVVMNEEERIIELEAALKASEAEVDKWRTGA